MRSQSLAYNKDIITNTAIIAAIGVLFFVLATAFGAYVRIPIKGTPVPVTLQTFFVILSGAFLGKRLGSFSQVSYCILGAIGLPIFQGSLIGSAYLLGPTTGYLAGFIAAAYIVGRMIALRPGNFNWAVLTFAAGSLTILFFGAAWLVFFYKMNIISAISAGVLPFIPGDIAKVLVAGIIYSGIKKSVKL